jgi:tetratricopeptide (TPR) repeat protein
MNKGLASDDQEQKRVQAALRVALAHNPVVWLETDNWVLEGRFEDNEVGSEPIGRQYCISCSSTLNELAFGPVREILRCLMPVAMELAPDLLAECQFEIAALLPDFLDSPVFVSSVRLESVVSLPINISRMLPRDSEFVLRIVTQIGWFLTRLGERLIAQDGRLPLFVFTGLEAADRPTLLTIYHLCTRTRHNAFRLLLTSAPLQLADASITRDGLFDTEYERRNLIWRLHERVKPVTLRMGIQRPWIPLSQGSNDAELIAYRDVLAVRDAGSDSDRIDAVTSALNLNALYFNPEAALDLARAILSEGDLTSELAVIVWQGAGAAHAALGNYSEAIDCFKHGSTLADTPEVRARMAMFASLVLVKRLGLFEEGERSLAEGYRAIADQKTSTATLERGWLNNVSALLAFRNGDGRRALRLTQETLTSLRSHNDDDAVGLKTNLVANISLVFERVANYDRALSMWQLFHTFLDTAGDLFVKFYYFREAGLNLKVGRIVEATVGYERVFNAAERTRDHVAMEAAARARAYIAQHTGDIQDAVRWAESIPPLHDRLGDDYQFSRSWLAVGAYRMMIGDQPGVQAALQMARTRAECLRGGEAQFLQALQQLDSSQSFDMWECWLPALPDTTLRQPYWLITP